MLAWAWGWDLVLLTIVDVWCCGLREYRVGGGEKCGPNAEAYSRDIFD